MKGPSKISHEMYPCAGVQRVMMAVLVYINSQISGPDDISLCNSGHDKNRVDKNHHLKIFRF
jgi:hypothetical protein